jgi:hypothetical protein
MAAEPGLRSAGRRVSVQELVMELAPYPGRLFLGSEKIAEGSPGPGTVLPTLVHGGPGHAGAGEELEGLRGLAFYMQRVALKGARAIVERLAGTSPTPEKTLDTPAEWGHAWQVKRFTHVSRSSWINPQTSP